MVKYIIIRLTDEIEAEQIIQTLLEELNTDGLRFRIGDSEDVYYGASDLASDISRVKMITEIEDD